MNAASIYCNETAEMLDVHTTFTSPNLLIDPAYPPQPDELSTRGSTMRYRKIFDDIQDMGLLSESTQPTLFKRIRQFDPFFELLITSPYALPLSDLGDLSKFDKVVSAISFQHGLIQAQAARLYMRGEEAYPPLDTNATVIRNLIEKMNNTDPYAAEVEVTRHRLVQTPLYRGSSRPFSARFFFSIYSGTSWVPGQTFYLEALGPSQAAWRSSLAGTYSTS